jgi:hypothetical protein
MKMLIPDEFYQHGREIFKRITTSVVVAISDYL